MRQRRKFVLGSRGSRLALVQAEHVATKIRDVFPNLDLRIHTIETRGDRDQSSLTQIGGIGIFVKDLEEALLNRRVDLAVHSLKDMPTIITNELALIGVTERIDPRDVLVSKFNRLDKLPAGATVGTSSFRRLVQLRKLRPDLKVRTIRGNVDTRLRKVFNGEFDAVIMAAAGMLRLGFEDKISEYLSPEDFVPPAGQGALGLEARVNDKEVAEIVSIINHENTWLSITAERTFLSALGGGCRAPIAALATIDGSLIHLQGMVANMSGENVLRASLSGHTANPAEIGSQLATNLLQMGASAFIEEVKACEIR